MDHVPNHGACSIEETITFLVAGTGKAFREDRWTALTAGELSERISPSQASQIEASREGFDSLSQLLAAKPSPDAYDALAHAVMGMAEADAVWLLTPLGKRWVMLGSAWRHAPVRALTPESALRKVVLSCGGVVVGALAFWYADQVSCVVPGAIEEAFEQAVASALRTRQALDESLRDPLTGLLNRRTLDDSLTRMIGLARRLGHPLALLMLDLDLFKQINDTHGHEAGDEVLKAFAALLSRNLRVSDMAVRYGGEEFLVVLPDTAPDEALTVADKLRASTAAMAVRVKEAMITPTVSVGIASLRPGEEKEELIARADVNMYRAKAAGRNRVAGEALLPSESR